jgi:hypothetical protein
VFSALPIKQNVTTPCATSAHGAGIDVSSFIDLVEDDEEVFTQISQPQVQSQVRLFDDEGEGKTGEGDVSVLEDLIEDDEVVSTQLEEMPKCSSVLGKRMRAPSVTVGSPSVKRPCIASSSSLRRG